MVLEKLLKSIACKVHRAEFSWISLRFALEQKKYLTVIFSMAFQFFFYFFFSLGKLSATTYSVPEGINYSLELIVCTPSSEPLDVLPGLDGAQGSHGVPFFILSPWSVLSVRLPVRVLSFTNSIAALLVHCTLSQPTFLLCAHCQWKVYPEKDKSLPCLSDFWLLLSPRRSPGSAFPPAAVAAGCVSSALGQAPGANSES